MKRLLIICVLLLLGPRSEAQVENRIHNVNDLMKKVVQKAKENDSLKQKHARFSKIEIVKDLNENGKVIGGEGPTQQGVGLPNKPPKLDPDEMLNLLLTRFDLALSDHKINRSGKEYYEVKFSPRANMADEKDLYKKAVVRLSGTLWIDANDLYMTRLTAEMPVERGYSAWGIGKVRGIGVEIKQSQKPDLNNLVLIDLVDVKVRYRIVFVHFSREYIHLYTDYEYVPPNSATQ